MRGLPVHRVCDRSETCSRLLEGDQKCPWRTHPPDAICRREDAPSSRTSPTRRLRRLSVQGVSTNPRRARGELGERLAEEHLIAAGYQVVERNFRTRYGELDLVASEPGALVFCEVKTRTEGSRAGPPTPLEAIGREKRRRLRLMAAQWLSKRGAELRPAPALLRFDAIGVTLTAAGRLARLEHVEDAF